MLRNDREIDALIKQVTLEEKVEMLHAKHMFASAGVERLGIAGMKYTDGPFGIREELQTNSWTLLGLENDKATFFPTGSVAAEEVARVYVHRKIPRVNGRLKNSRPFRA